MSTLTRAATVHDGDDLAVTLEGMGLAQARPVIMLVGGADRLARGHEQALRAVFASCLSPLAQELGAAIVDGGTDSGVMRMIGRARVTAGHDYPLVGVASAGTIGTRAGSGGRQAPVDRNHSHLVVVPGERWGDESRWLTTVARIIARGRGRVTLLVNGGRVAHAEAVDSAASGVPVVLLSGSGRAADRLAGGLDPASRKGEAVAMTRVELGDLDTLRAVLTMHLVAAQPSSGPATRE